MILNQSRKTTRFSPGTYVCTQRSMLALVLNPETQKDFPNGRGMGEWSTLLLFKMNSQRAEVTMKVRKQEATGAEAGKQANHGTNSLLCPTKTLYYIEQVIGYIEGT